MPTAVEALLAAFDALPAGEQEAVVAQLLLRCPVGADDMPQACYQELTDELFLTYDAAEAADDSTGEQGTIVLRVSPRV